MASINKAVLLGNLTRDPEIRTFPSGDRLANVSIATNDRWKDKATGEMKEAVEFHRVVFFGRLAEIVEQYLRKGSQAYIEGSLHTRAWEKDGVKQYSTEIRADQMQMLGGREAGNAATQTGERRDAARGAAMAAAQPKRPTGAAGSGFDDMDDDIPF